MLSKLTTILILTLMVGTAAGISAQDSEVEVVVGEIGPPERSWGKQNLVFEVSNRTDWLKFLVVETDVGFEESYATPHRVVRSNFILEPGVTTTIDPVLEIPGNYGKLAFWLRIYDVVDTLDDLSLGVQVYEQPFQIRFTAPEAVLPYFEERLSLPPMVGNHGMLDNEFQRLMLLMVAEGKTPEEIANLCRTKAEYVAEVGKDMTGAKLLKEVYDGYEPAVPVITSAFAVDGRKLVDRVSDQMAPLLADNLTGLPGLRDSLAQAGVYSNDSASFVEGGSLLYQPYPLVAGLYLWRSLGQMFIVNNRSLEIFVRTDPCNAKIGFFTYMVQGGDHFVGHHYYLASESRSGFVAHFGDQIPEVECLPGFERKVAARQNQDWKYGTEWTPDAMVYDTTLVNPALRMLDPGVRDILREASSDLRQLAVDHGHPTLTVGLRYWFWNLLASRIADQMVEAGTLTRSGNGQYRLMAREAAKR